MPTPGERLATIEQALREVRDDVRQLRDEVSGGNGVQWDRSVRGRLHKIEGSLSGMVMRRSVGLGMLKGWQAFLLVGCGIATTAAAWYAALHP